jgi:hypothetical protein
MLQPKSSLELARHGEELLRMPLPEAARALDRLTLSERVELVLALPPGPKRQELILRSSNPAELARELPVEDFVLTLKTIGYGDALPLIALSSAEQLGHALDLDLWRLEGVDLGRFQEWLRLLGASHPERLDRYLDEGEFELLALMAERWLSTVDREALPDLPDDQAARVVTPDNYHVFVVHPGADLDVIRDLVERLYRHDREKFFALWGNLGTNPPAEIEERARRFRDGRLADRGWPELEEAEEFYRPLKPAEARRGRNIPRGVENPPRFALAVPGGPLWNDALSRVEDEALRGRLASQAANLVNRVLVADGRLAAEMAETRYAFERVLGRLEIGLSLLGARDGAEARRWIESVPLIDLCRVAQDAILQRARRARGLLEPPPGHWVPHLPHPMPELLSNLATPRPRLVDPDTLLPREFGSIADFDPLDAALDRCQTLLHLAGALGGPQRLPRPFPPGSIPPGPEGLEIPTLLATAFVRQRLRLPPEPAPVPFSAAPRIRQALPGNMRDLAEEISKFLVKLGGARNGDGDALAEWLAANLWEDVVSRRPEELDERFCPCLWWANEGPEPGR